MSEAGRPVVCPAWCRGCGPNDPMHRGFLATVGRERTGWVSLQLLVDRFVRREAAVKLDATRYGVNQTVLLSPGQVDRLVEELTQARRLMRAPAGRAGEGR
ncbi:precorrin-4 C11-methyltransferase [Micromonospora sp. WMMD987]|uniref:precorrin-4 C11-methyltransferase n=1 Tax=Micromonospora sp. WMMD987 TaxID=3016089 RepID=UPI00249B5388|nr:precorrin-4 C11-methyltransferase [Micromonospora sp. WMMD987]WFE94870.1 precorrin-4 C11-methyltransferase [Micromonospora sp. WMMD987]